MCGGLTSADRARDGWIVARVVACLLALVLLMADDAGAVETVHLPLPPPLQGALEAGPYNFQFTGEDQLRLTVVNSLAGVTVGVHFRTAPTTLTTQSNREILVARSDRVGSMFEFNVGTGYLLNVSVFAVAGSPRIGQTFVKLQVIRGSGAAAIVLGTVVQGYITANQDRAWPGSPLEDSISGGGVVRTIQGTDPAAGVICFDAVPTGARWQVLAYAVSLTTSAAVGTRAIRLFLSSSVNPYIEAVQPGTMAAGSVNAFYWAVGMAVTAVVGSGPYFQGLPIDCPLLAGDSVGVTAAGLDAGDNFGVPQLQVREWLEVP